MNDEKVVMYDDPGIASAVTVSMWRDTKGSLHLSEHAARYWSCTHRPCSECGAPTPKSCSACDACREKQAVERFMKKPAAGWTEGPLYSDSLNRYFDDPDDAIDYAEGYVDDGVTLENMRLELCQPTHPRELTPDHFDEIPLEDFDGCEIPFPAKIEKAIDVFNATVKDLVVGWAPSGVRWDYSTRNEKGLRDPQENP